MARSNPQDILSGIIGRSPCFTAALDLAQRVAPHKLAVLIHGETGTGKEAVARLIHAASGRTGRFVALNCAAVTDALVESELFGHERGSFTGANTAHRGLFEEADGGTLFLDEIGELLPLAQAKLLRVLQEGTVRRVGSTVERRVDTRILCATHVDLDQAVASGRFRQDLRYRLTDMVIELPALRDRGADVALIADHFLRTEPVLAGRRLTPAARQHLRTLELPGNVRDLRQVLLRAAFDEPVGPITLGQTAVSEEDQVLELLAETLPVRALAERVQISKRGLNRLLGDLESRGLVRRLGDGPTTEWRRA
ncbi:MAG: sigma-54-dependent Fis family transcriptional regulator [Alphaproteobacteria bacterium]|nr:sigma-54-dependent Fis family transcriptional regulator [Alphaproteobacteria bacterium]